MSQFTFTIYVINADIYLKCTILIGSPLNWTGSIFKWIDKAWKSRDSSQNCECNELAVENKRMGSTWISSDFTRTSSTEMAVKSNEIAVQTNEVAVNELAV